MDDIPDVWPPPEGRDSGTSGSGGLRPLVVPIFPLPNVWLFPYVPLALQIFEPRYRQMVEDCLDGPGRIVLGTILPGHEGDMSSAPPYYPVACLGEIARHVRLSDGRFNIWLFGLMRVQVIDVKSDRLYRRVEATPMREDPVAAEREENLRTRLRNAILQRVEALETLPPNVPASNLTDILLRRLPLPPEVRQRLFAEPHVEKRALGALEQHGIRPREG